VLSEFGEIGKFFEDPDWELPEAPTRSVRKPTLQSAKKTPPKKKKGKSERKVETFETGVMPDEDEDIEEASRQSDLEDMLFLEELKEHRRIISEMKRQMPKIFAFIFNQISIESEQIVARDPEWDEVYKEKDPIRFWAIIRRTHLMPSQGDQIQMRSNARDVYASLRQGATESIASFKERFQHAVMGLDAVGEHVPDDATQAMDFLKWLDDARYASLKCDLYNAVALHGSERRPQSLTQAYAFASEYRVVVPGRDGGASKLITASAFVAHGNATKKNANKKRGKEVEKESKAGRDSKDKKASKDTKARGCFYCQDPGHKLKDCPAMAEAKRLLEDKKKQRENANVAFSRYDDNDGGATIDERYLSGSHPGSRFETAFPTICATPTGLGRYDVLLDNQATTSLFKERSLLTNVRRAEAEASFDGVGGTLRTDTVGEFREFGTVYFSPRAPANILSYSAVRKTRGFNIALANRAFIVTTPQHRYVFAEAPSGLHVWQATPAPHPLYLTSVDDNKAKFQRREVLGAEQARDLLRKLGYPSERDMMKMISHGGILNSPVTTKDVRVARAIFGPDLATLKGKTKRIPPRIAETDTNLDVKRPPVELHVDIMFVDGEPFLLSLGKPIELLTVTHLKSRRASDIQSALLEHVQQYEGQRFRVERVLTDGEGGVAASAPALQARGIAVNIAGPEQHVPAIEAKIKQLKERVRCHLTSLPFKLTRLMLVWLVFFCVSRINMMPSTLWSPSTTESPREMFLGRKVHYDVDLRVGFGDYLQAKVPNQESSSMKSRTEGCIALAPLGNVQGTVRCFRLMTREVVLRDAYHILPIPADVIAYLNSLAAAEKNPVNGTPTFRLGHTVVGDDTTDPDPPAAPVRPEIADAAPPVVDTPTPTVRVADERPPPPPPPLSSEPVPAHRGVRTATADAPVADNGSATAAEDTARHEPRLADVAQEPAEREGTPAALEEAPPQLPTPDMDPPSAPSARYGLRNRGTLQMPKRYANCVVGKEYGLHVSARQALREHGEKGLTAIVEELQQLLDKKVMHPIDTREMSKSKFESIIRSSMFLKEKYKPDGSFDKLKARLVAGGNMQDRALYDDQQISSATVHTDSVMMIAAIAAKERRKIVTMDIAGAYLNAPMNASEVYMRLDRLHTEVLCALDPAYNRFVCRDGTVVVKLDKALYGCVESAKLWYKHLSKTLVDLGFKQNARDECVFNKTTRGQQVTVCFHVDDLMITSVCDKELEALVQALTNVYGSVTVHRGATHDYLGMRFEFTADGECQLTMHKMVSDLLAAEEVEGTSSTPATEKLFEIRDSPMLDEARRQRFHSSVAKMLYIAKRARPDLFPLVAFLSTRVLCATEDDWDKLQRGLRYLNGSLDYKFKLCGADDRDISVKAYIDASYGVHNDAKSHSGLVLTLGRAPVIVKSAKQKIVTKSSTEAELVSLSDMTTIVLWVSEWLSEQGYRPGAATIFQDNQSTIRLATNGLQSASRSKHISTRYFWMKDQVSQGRISVIYLPTHEMVADIMTKPLCGARFRYLRKRLMGF